MPKRSLTFSEKSVAADALEKLYEALSRNPRDGRYYLDQFPYSFSSKEYKVLKTAIQKVSADGIIQVCS